MKKTAWAAEKVDNQLSIQSSQSQSIFHDEITMSKSSLHVLSPPAAEPATPLTTTLIYYITSTMASSDTQLALPAADNDTGASSVPPCTHRCARFAQRPPSSLPARCHKPFSSSPLFDQH
jgi:hypothetical protein